MGCFLKRPLPHAALPVLLLSLILVSSDSHAQAPEFKVLELERDFRSSTPDPKTREGREKWFELAEARYDSQMGSAEEAFRKLEKPVPHEPLDWLALVYRVKLEESAREPLERRLKDALSARGFFAVFDAKRVSRWKSPSGHAFEFREYVDRLEIYRDDRPFFTLQLG